MCPTVAAFASLNWPSKHDAKFERLTKYRKANIHAAFSHVHPLKSPTRFREEPFFKWIKQHLRIKKFLGNSENAVKTQIWCAVSTYVLIAIVKKDLQLDASLYTLLQILSVSVFEKNELACAFQLDSAAPEMPLGANQLSLFNI